MKNISRNIKNIFTENEKKLFSKFKTPHDIQIYLDKIKYNAVNETRSPKFVIQNKRANCFEGALFAAAALRFMGYKPLIVDLMAVNDDDHVIAVFKKNGLYGAVAKSNTTLLRFREPVYRTVRELAMSYFDFYFNTFGQKSLRSYTIPIDLSKFDKHNWMTTEEDLEFIGDYLFEINHHNLIDAKSICSLSYADKYLIDICFTGSIVKGLYKPEKK